MPISPEAQVQFLLKIQRLLGEGLFTATYKFALLMALADLSVELGDDSDAGLDVDVERIADKFIEYYWRQTLPYLGRDTLRQNKGKPPVIVRLLLNIRLEYGDHLAAVQRDSARWRHLNQAVMQNVRAMPLRYLQNVGGESLPFIYEPPTGVAPAVIRLFPGVAFCLRQFHGLVAELVQAAWTRWIRQQNLPIIGEGADLHEFLFGSRRSTLLSLQAPLQDLQNNVCFYCHKEMSGQADVDHFVPWSLYQLDLGHNFVLAHRTCNSAKRDLLASEEHLAAWVSRNKVYGMALSYEFDRVGILNNLESSTRIARWAYNSASTLGGQSWQAKEKLVPLKGEWRSLLACEVPVRRTQRELPW